MDKYFSGEPQHSNDWTLDKDRKYKRQLCLIISYRQKQVHTSLEKHSEGTDLCQAAHLPTYCDRRVHVTK